LQKEAIKISNEKIQSGKYDIVILDEINYAVNLNLISLEDVLDLINSKPQKLDLILTGNYAKNEVIEAADLVTEMREINIHFSVVLKQKKGLISNEQH
jgi:cob(I)yrinic acid a,c-diamide adenosyltransferase (EC 2.5.1.17)